MLTPFKMQTCNVLKRTSATQTHINSAEAHSYVSLPRKAVALGLAVVTASTLASDVQARDLTPYELASKIEYGVSAATGYVAIHNAFHIITKVMHEYCHA